MATYNKQEIIGRHAEQLQLADILASREAELLAVYGRRRVGKTYLIRAAYADSIAFEFIGTHNATLATQLENFERTLARLSAQPGEHIQSWSQAFDLLRQYLAPVLKQRKRVIFLDEFPWIQTRRSNFLPAFAYFWNAWASTQRNLVVVICGSSASWMIRKVLNDRGGLHNRVTRRMRLLPFTVAEVGSFLHHRGLRLDQYQLLEIYMAMGGIPQYLRELKPGESAAQAINRICFSKDGFLNTEFQNLFRSLFEQSEYHMEVIEALARKSSGLTRNELIEKCSFSSGGTATQVLQELTESGFIAAYVPFDKKVKDSIFKLTDEYSLFYIRFVQPGRSLDKDAWQRISTSPSWKSWAGYAFESICMKHINAIKRALGIEGVYTEISVWRATGNAEAPGAQIDLLIDRADNCINLCEIKFVNGEFVIDKKYAAELDAKVRIFRERTGTRKTIFPTLITTYGTRKNDHYTGRVQAEVLMKDLF